jgi:orotate phosphoribosyltransferase
MNHSQLAEAIYNICYLRGEFRLRSGSVSNEYFDKYRFEAQPQLLKAIAKHLAPLIPNDTQVIAGLELGGVPIATALSLETGIPMAFVRKEPKDYGTCQFCEGSPVAGKNVLVIEDVVSTGGQVLLSTRDLRNIGAHITTVLAIIDRTQGKQEALMKEGLTFKALFTMEQLKSYAKK